MSRLDKTVFISYRRTNAPWALAIFQALNHHGYDAFFDFMGIASGDFETVILENIRARAHFVVLLTPSALERCHEPGDWLRREIETALESRRNIVPLMLESFDFGTPAIANQLTGKLAVLKSYNALRVPVEYFQEAMSRLRDKHLNVSLDAVLHPASTLALEAAKVDQTAARTAPEVQEKELTAQQWFEQGFNALDIDEKLRCYSEAVALDPDYAGAYNNRGNARAEKGDLDGALQDYAKAIRLRPDDAPAYYNRAKVRGSKGDLDGALQDYAQAIRLKPDHAAAYNNRGNTRRTKGDLDGGLQDLGEAIRLKPDYAAAYNNRGIARRDKGDLDGALHDFAEAIRIKRDDANVYYNRAIARRDSGDLDGALQDYADAIRLKPDHANAYYNRAQIWQEAANHKAAIADLQRYLDIGGGSDDGDQAGVERIIHDLRKKLEG